MSFVEFGSVMFRGDLVAATGVFKGRFTVEAIDAVDTINIKTNQITFQERAAHSGKSVTSGQPALSFNFVMPDSWKKVEIVAYGSLCNGLRLDGVTIPIRSGVTGLVQFRPLVALVDVDAGSHTIDLMANSTGWSDSGYILVRYIRETGA